MKAIQVIQELLVSPGRQVRVLADPEGVITLVLVVGGSGKGVELVHLGENSKEGKAYD